jgi:hypothetical protein
MDQDMEEQEQERIRKLFGFGRAGEPVSTVDPKDVKAVWELSSDFEREHPGTPGAVGIEVFKSVCSPGADIPAITYRAQMMWVVQHASPEALAPWTQDSQLTDAVFRAIAEVPMEWVGVGVSRQGLPFDADDFLRRVREAA